MQKVYDNLYDKSKKGYKFKKLMNLISCRENIVLAYRNIKGNKGSKTVGTDKLNINFIKDMEVDIMVKRIQQKLKNYNPKSVRRVNIPKPNGKTRPLGIPCIEDRLIQQCIKQILEPICEAKFHKHSYGFRPNRSTHHAIARCMHNINHQGTHYVVDIDIKGFFDNVNHNKLKKQIWNLGIQDKNLICILGKMLKSEILGEGKPTKGTPQGGILSPLLSNIVLNELDWWISNQWETFDTNHKYKTNSDRYYAQKGTKLKEMWIVRYADDFKIFCRTYKDAQKIFIATRKWLTKRLNLEISSEKSKITNLRKNYSEFLGIKLKAVPKKNKYVCNSRVNDKAVNTMIFKLKEQIKVIQKSNDSKDMCKLNAMILGMHNYYNCATHVVKDFGKINFLVNKTLKNRLKSWITNKPSQSETFKKLYGEYNGKPITIMGITLFPIYGCKTKPPMNFKQGINNFTSEGRKLIHKNIGGYVYLIEHLLSTKNNHSTEYNDNRIASIAGQRGKCYVTKVQLNIDNMECHHKRMRSNGGSDAYSNLVWVTKEIHKLIHSTENATIIKYINKLNLDLNGFKRLNYLRKLVGNSEIII